MTRSFRFPSPFDRTQLSDAEESLLCYYPMVIDYILEINLTKRKEILWFHSLLMVLANQNRYRIDQKQGLSSAMSQ